MVPLPSGDAIKNVKQAMGSWIQWPSNLVLIGQWSSTTPNKKFERKKKRRTHASSEDSIDFEFRHETITAPMPHTLSMLYMWGDNGFQCDKSIQVEVEPEVFGEPQKTYILGNDVYSFVTMEKLGGNVISVYMKHLFDRLAKYKMLDMVSLVDPSQIGNKGYGNKEKRSTYISKRMLAGKLGQILLMAYNTGDHWVLNVVHPDTNTVYFMNPSGRRLLPANDPWYEVMKIALLIYNAKKVSRKDMNREELPVKWKNMGGVPPQPDDKQCGYFVMRYMRDIIEDKDPLAFVIKWERRKNLVYKQEDIDVVRNEWAKFVVGNYL